MREIIARNSVLLKNDEWVQLRTVKAPDKKINGYTFSHEIRCQGNIVSFLPYRKETTLSGEHEITEYSFLLRKEAVPCWELDTPILSSFTGGCDKEHTPRATFIKELGEEAGYIVDAEEENRIVELGTSYATKSTDSTFHLYAVDLTDFPDNKIKELYVETELEQASTNEWVKAKDLDNIMDPFVCQIVIRLLKKIDK